jgi:predicted transcriptional regulator
MESSISVSRNPNNMPKKKSDRLEPIEEIRRLIILGLVNQGVKGKDIAAILEVDPAIISRLLSPTKAKKQRQNGE